jgi:uncharacterized membrane protein YphA (DoxX/SURF4 family)
MKTFQDPRLSSSYWALRWTYILVPIIAGLDKSFFNLLTTWTQYLSDAFPRMLHLSPRTFLHLAGIVEIVAGILVASKFTRLGAYVVMAWLICIAINLVSMHMFDVAVRDLAMAVGAFALARLEEVRANVPVRRARTHVTAPA